MAKSEQAPAGASGSHYFIVTCRAQHSCHPSTRCSARSPKARTSLTGSARSPPTQHQPRRQPDRLHVDLDQRAVTFVSDDQIDELGGTDRAVQILVLKSRA